MGRVVGIDAVDPSPGMLAKGRRLRAGDHPTLTWILGYAEDALLWPPYGLVTAASSLHWMDWPVVLPRFRRFLAPGGVLAIVGERPSPNSWDDDLQQIIDQYSTNRRFRSYNLISELTSRSLFREVGRHLTNPDPFVQSIEHYVESIHSRNGFSRDRMTAGAAAAFDQAVVALVKPDAPEGMVTLNVAAEVIWGLPAPM